MKHSHKYDSRKVLRRIRLHRRQLEVALQSNADFKQLHSDILRLLIVICNTKSEYKDFVEYPKPPIDIEVGLSSADAESFRHETMSSFPEESFIQSRKELGARLKEKLEQLDAEYVLRNKLEPTEARSHRRDIESIKKELQDLRSEVLRLSREITNIKTEH